MPYISSSAAPPSSCSRSLAADSQETLWEIKAFENGHQQQRFPLVVPGTTAWDLWPASLATTAQGSWLVLDGGERGLLRFDAAWQYQGSWPQPIGGAPFDQPTCLRRSGDEYWVVDQNNHNIRWLAADGRQLAQFGSLGSGPGQLRFPFSLDVCAGRWVAVTDMGNYRVQRFTLDGRFLDGFEPAPVAPGVPVQLLDVAVSADCTLLYVVDSKGNRVLVTTPTGEVRQQLGRWK